MCMIETLALVARLQAVLSTSKYALYDPTLFRQLDEGPLGLLPVPSPAAATTTGGASTNYYWACSALSALADLVREPAPLAPLIANHIIASVAALENLLCIVSQAQLVEYRLAALDLLHQAHAQATPSRPVGTLKAFWTRRPERLHCIVSLATSTADATYRLSLKALELLGALPRFCSDKTATAVASAPTAVNHHHHHHRHDAQQQLQRLLLTSVWSAFDRFVATATAAAAAAEAAAEPILNGGEYGGLAAGAGGDGDPTAAASSAASRTHQVASRLTELMGDLVEHSAELQPVLCDLLLRRIVRCPVELEAELAQSPSSGLEQQARLAVVLACVSVLHRLVDLWAADAVRGPALAPEPALVQLLAHFLHCPLSVSANRNATGKRIVQALLKLAAACVHYAGTLQAPAATPLRHLLGGTLLT